MPFLSSLKRTHSNMPRIGYSEIKDEKDEEALLLDGQQQNRCCSGLFRLYGPDGVWAWAVAFANFLVNFIIVGLGRMSGILYVDVMTLFNIDRKTASIPFSIQNAGRNLFAPVAGILGQKYGIRFVTILGGIIGSLCGIILYFKMDVTSFSVFWGLFFGLSTALTITLSQASVDQYFEKHRATAGGLAFSGGCVGAFIFPFIIDALLIHYGMKGTFLVIGCIILHVVPAAIILVEPPWKEIPTDGETINHINTKYGTLNVEEAFRTRSGINAIDPPAQIYKNASPIVWIDFEALQNSSDIVLRFLTMAPSCESAQSKVTDNDPQKFDEMCLLNELECIYSKVANLEMKDRSSSVALSNSVAENGIPFAKSEINPDKNERHENDKFANKMHDETPQGVYIRTKLKELYEAKGTELVSRFSYSDQTQAWKILIELRKLYENLTEPLRSRSDYSETEHISLVPSALSERMDVEQDNKMHSNSFCSLMKTAFKLHYNPLFLLICICRGVFMLTFIPVVTIIVDFGIDKGLERSDGKYIIGALSLGDFLGRLCLGWITDCGCLSLSKYMLVCMLILGGSTATIPLMTNKYAFIASVLFFGILQGSLFVRHAILVSKYLKSHEHAIGMGFINFLSGFLGFALPAFIGYFRDTLGSYDKMFYLNGGICVVVGLLWSLEPVFLRVINSQQEEQNKSESYVNQSEEPDLLRHK